MRSVSQILLQSSAIIFILRGVVGLEAKASNSFFTASSINGRKYHHHNIELARDPAVKRRKTDIIKQRSKFIENEFRELQMVGEGNDDIIAPINVTFGAPTYGESCLIDQTLITDINYEFPNANFSPCESLACGSFGEDEIIDYLTIICYADCELCVNGADLTTDSTTSSCATLYTVYDYFGDISSGNMTNYNSVVCAQNTNDDEVCLEHNYTSCSVSYNAAGLSKSTKCNLCSLIECEDPDAFWQYLGIEADCTNIEPGAQINSCTNEGYVGAFSTIPMLTSNENVYSVGICNDSPGQSPIFGGDFSLFDGDNISFCESLESEEGMYGNFTSKPSVIQREFPEALIECSHKCENNLLESNCQSSDDCEICDTATSLCATTTEYSMTNFSSQYWDTAFTFCMKYTQGNETGEVCTKTDMTKCEITYNGESCNSCQELPCSTTEGQGSFGIFADCTNINIEANINTCINYGLVGVFRVLDENSFNHSSSTVVCKSDAKASVPITDTATIGESHTIINNESSTVEIVPTTETAGNNLTETNETRSESSTDRFSAENVTEVTATSEAVEVMMNCLIFVVPIIVGCIYLL